MAKHKKSMLEAFKTAGEIHPPRPQGSPQPTPQPAAKPAPEATPAPKAEAAPAVIPAAPAPRDGVITPAPRRPSAAATNAGGPFVEPETAVPARPPLAAAASVPDSSSASTQKSLKAPSSALVWVLLGLIVISFSGAAWFGNQDQGTAPGDQGANPEATGPTEGSLSGGFAPSAGAPSSGTTTRTPAAAALGQAGAGRAPNPIMDPANRYTVVVITYGKSHTDLASAHQEFLRDSGLPVNPLLHVKNKLVICVGASATREELTDLEDRIHKLSFNGERGVYSDAYVDAINKYVDR